MFSVLEGLLGEVPLPLDLDVQGLWYVRHQDVDELTHPEHQVLKDDDKGELEGEDLPVDGGEGARVVPEPPVVTLRLEFI